VDGTVDEVCDQVLAGIVSDRSHDDIALIAVRCAADDGGR
jgi:hypothetical protein